MVGVNCTMPRSWELKMFLKRWNEHDQFWCDLSSPIIYKINIEHIISFNGLGFSKQKGGKRRTRCYFK